MNKWEEVREYGFLVQNDALHIIYWKNPIRISPLFSIWILSSSFLSGRTILDILLSKIPGRQQSRFVLFNTPPRTGN